MKASGAASCHRAFSDREPVFRRASALGNRATTRHHAAASSGRAAECPSWQHCFISVFEPLCCPRAARRASLQLHRACVASGGASAGSWPDGQAVGRLRRAPGRPAGHERRRGAGSAQAAVVAERRQGGRAPAGVWHAAQRCAKTAVQPACLVARASAAACVGPSATHVACLLLCMLAVKAQAESKQTRGAGVGRCAA